MTKTLDRTKVVITGAAVALVMGSYGSAATPLHPVGVFTSSGVTAMSGYNFGDQAYFWTTAWQRDEAEVDDDYATGNYYEPKDARDLIRWLRDG